MEDIEAIRARHSVRSYIDRPLEKSKVDYLQSVIDRCNDEGDLRIRLCLENPEAFNGGLARYGRFKGVRNYIFLAGPDGSSLDERCGYYGERIALEAQKAGLNTCWVGQTYRKKVVGAALKDGQRLVCVVALGYGESPGRPHKVKPLSALCRVDGAMPGWFEAGVRSAQLAPTALNRQRFILELVSRDRVSLRMRRGLYAGVDSGIVKLHFEIGANDVSRDWSWA